MQISMRALSTIRCINTTSFLLAFTLLAATLGTRVGEAGEPRSEEARGRVRRPGGHAALDAASMVVLWSRNQRYLLFGVRGLRTA